MNLLSSKSNFLGYKSTLKLSIAEGELGCLGSLGVKGQVMIFAEADSSMGLVSQI